MEKGDKSRRQAKAWPVGVAVGERVDIDRDALRFTISYK